MPIEFQELLQDLELQSRNGMVVTSALLRSVNLRHRQTQPRMTADRLTQLQEEQLLQSHACCWSGVA